MPRGTNFPRVGHYNQQVVLDAVRRAPNGVSQVQLVTKTGLSPQTVSTITRRLLEAGLLRTDGVLISGRGKPRTTLRINASSQYAIGIHLDPAIVTVALTDLEGRSVAQITSRDALGSDPTRSLDHVASLVHNAVADSGVDTSLIAGIGVASPGPLDIKNGALLNPPWLPGWDGFSIRDAVRTWLPLPVVVDKDTIAEATGESWARHDLEGVTLLFMYLGTGVGSAVSINGEVLRGSSNNAGEIGHLVVDSGTLICDCGRRGCLGRMSDPHFMVKDAYDRQLLSRRAKTITPATVDQAMTEICGLAAAGHADAHRLLVRSAAAVGEAARTLVGVHDSSLLVFGGPYWSRLAPYYLPVIREQLTSAPETRIQMTDVQGTVMGEAGGAIGAASLVFDSAYSPRPEISLLHA